MSDVKIVAVFGESVTVSVSVSVSAPWNVSFTPPENDRVTDTGNVLRKCGEVSTCVVSDRQTNERTDTLSRSISKLYEMCGCVAQW